MEEKDLRDAADMVRHNHSFLIACHVKPDGDTLGTALAVANALGQMGKDVVVLSVDGVPETYAFLPDSEVVVASTPKRGFDVAIVPDCDGITRVGDALETVRSARKIIAMDHHASGPPFGDIGLYNSEAAATAEIAIDFIDQLGVTLDEQMATCLMTAIVSDTGAFRFPNVTPRTFLHAARLKAAGASPSRIATIVYENKSAAGTRLLGVALASLSIDDSGEIAWSRITLRDFERVGGSEADTEGIVNFILAVKGTKVALFFREAPDGTTRVSLRSRYSIDVSEVAKTFDGGGHAAAAGCTLSQPLADAERLVVEEVRKCMER